MDRITDLKQSLPVAVRPNCDPAKTADLPGFSPVSYVSGTQEFLHVTIGILAHNEERLIAQTIRSLFGQSIFNGASAALRLKLDIVVVPNGCSDGTARIADRALAESTADLKPPQVGCRVVSLAKPGKSNAWNELVHSIAEPATDVFVMMDADIEFAHPQTIENSVVRLLTDAGVGAVVDRPLNDLSRKAHPNVLERILARLSFMKFDGPPGIAGSFYCARGDTLREIWMPPGLPAEDGFLAAMIMTDCFRRTEPDRSRLARARDAAHYYEGLSSVRGIVRHEVRLAVGIALNCYLCWDALLFLVAPTGAGAGEVIRQLNRNAPGWYEKMMANAIANRGIWALPRGLIAAHVRDRFGSLPRRSLPEALVRLPVLLAAFVLDLVVLFLANRRLKRGEAVNHW